jgi:hypothetical protein
MGLFREDGTLRPGMLIALVTAMICLVLVLTVRQQAPGDTGDTGAASADLDPCATIEGSGPPTSRLVVQAGNTAEPGPTADVPPVSDRQPAFGVITEGGFGSPQQWDEVSRVAGESPTLITAYASFLEPLPLAGLEAVAARGATPVVVWEPWDPTQPIDQWRFGLTTIVAGHHDTYLREWAGGLKDFGKPVVLRFAHEMNYPWYPWGAGVNGNTPEQYVAAWRYMHALFEAEGVENVSWAWNPQAPECGDSVRPFWPGSDVVDLVALDAYNWGTDREGERWRSPEDLFGEGFRQLREIAPGIPIIIGETGSSETGGSKAAWIADLVRYLGEQPDVHAFIWFDLRKEEDWRIISSESSAAAFGEALRERR